VPFGSGAFDFGSRSAPFEGAATHKASGSAGGYLLGVGLGPVLKWVDPSHFDATIRILGMLALILILFEGGLELRLKDAIRYSPGGILLAFVSYGFTLGLVALIVRQLLHMSWTGVLVGAVLGSRSAAVVLPAIEQISAPEPIKITLTL